MSPSPSIYPNDNTVAMALAPGGSHAESASMHGREPESLCPDGVSLRGRVRQRIGLSEGTTLQSRRDADARLTPRRQRQRQPRSLGTGYRCIIWPGRSGLLYVLRLAIAGAVLIACQCCTGSQMMRSVGYPQSIDLTCITLVLIELEPNR